MDECLQKQALCYTPFWVSGPGLFRVLQLGVPVNKLLPTGGRDSDEVAGCSFPDGFGNGLVVIQDHQEEEPCLFRVLSSGALLQTFCPPGAGSCRSCRVWLP